MEALECIKTRRSVRKYTDKPVTEETIRQLIELASYAPSWKNCQPIRYTAVFDKDIQKKIADSCVMNFPGNKKIIDGCSVLLIPSIKHGRSGFERDGSYSTKKEDRWEVFDAGIAAQTVTLAANAMGLATVIMGIFDPDMVAEAIDLPDDQIVATMIGIGYPDEEPKMPPRKSVDDLLTIR
ncbi:MAG: nitroreductase family protein [Eubacterium sp.]|jgi:nitroreductase